MSNIVLASFGASNIANTKSIWQYDYGMILKIVGIDLPTVYEVHFSNTDNGTATTSIGTASGCIIPDEYIESGETIYAWVFLHTGTDDGETQYKVIIPVRKRPAVYNEEGSNIQDDAITQLINTLQTILADMPTEEQIEEFNNLLAEAQEIIGTLPDDLHIPDYTLDYVSGGGNYSIMLKEDSDTNKGNVHAYTKPIKDSTGLITAGAVYNAVNLPEEIDSTGQSISIFLNPDKYYIYGTLYDLQMLIRDRTDDGNVHRYRVMFTSGDTPTDVTLPSGCRMQSGFEVRANHTYEIEIVQINGQLFGKYMEW